MFKKVRLQPTCHDHNDTSTGSIHVIALVDLYGVFSYFKNEALILAGPKELFWAQKHKM